jgi:poly(A) polymerase
MMDIWLLQPRLERRSGKSVFKILDNSHFRAAFDFLLIRCNAGDLDAETGEWWKAFVAGSAEERQTLLETLSKRAADNSRSRKRRRRRKKRPVSPDLAPTTTHDAPTA